MARKKIVKEEFTPSKYQQAIFDFIKNNDGDLLVEAVAGSGKTTTIIKALGLIPEDKSVLFCAFNKDIVKVLTKKTKAYKNVEVRTIHGLGYKVCISNFEQMSRKIETNKYLGEFYSNTDSYTQAKERLKYREWGQYQKNLSRLLELARLNLANTPKEIKDTIERYGLSLVADEMDVVLKLMEWGMEHTETLDYTDMVWYPNVYQLDLKEGDFDYIFVDEAQDLSKAQREFILKCGHEGTRRIFVGDSNQAIYGFSAADPESFNELRKIPNIMNLPLSVCYRCPKSVIDFVHGLVPEIEATEDAFGGTVNLKDTLSSIEDQDMVLCRYNAPLFAMYNALVERKKKAFIVGKDIGASLINAIKGTQHTMLNVDLESKGVFSSLYRDYFIKRQQLKTLKGWSDKLCDNDPNLSAMKDVIIALTFISHNIKTSAQLIDKISKIFEDNVSEGIILSTIHKAKGLEANNVFVIENASIKHMRENATLEWEKTQERNLFYVACTRSKKKLSFIDQEDFDVSVNILNTDRLNAIEKKINLLYSEHKKNPVRLPSPFISVGKTLDSTPKKAINQEFNSLIGKKKTKTNLFK